MPYEKQNRIWLYRKKRQITQRRLARLMGVPDRREISCWELGTKTPTLENALKLEAALGTPVGFLFKPMAEQIREEVNQRRDELSASSRE